MLELIDFYDETTGFTAMERTTGWDGSIVAIMMAKDTIEKGVIPVETAILGDMFIDELRKRGFKITVNVN